MRGASTRSIYLRLHDFALGSISVAAILGVIAYANAEARALMLRLVNGDLSLASVVPDGRLHSLLRTAIDVSIHDHPEISAFVVIGVLLFVAMFKL